MDHVHVPPDVPDQTAQSLYKPLDATHFQIRVLVLSAGLFESRLEGRLETITFDDPTQYDALSYVWGTAKAAVPMSIEGHAFQISQNLDSALRHIRCSDSETRIWVDAVCINQPDLREKAEQVKHMGEMYARATKAIVWLGDAGAGFESVKKFLRDLDLTRREYLTSFGSDARDSMPRQNRLRHTDPEFSHALRMQKRPTKVLEGLLDLLSRPYWERVWIIQEISKASIVQIRFGAFESPLNPLLLASRNLKNLSERSKTLLRAILRFRAQEQGYGSLADRTRMSLVDAMIVTRYSMASLSRDKIYALLSLTSDGTNLVPIPSYVTSEERIFDDLTSAIIRSQQPSNVLLLTRWVPLRDRLGEGAKWSVDWANLGYHIPPWLCKLPRSRPALMTSRSDFDGIRLATRGLHIGTLTQVQGASRRAAGPASPNPVRHRVRSEAEVSADPEAAGILKQLTSDLLSKFAPGFRSTSTLTTTQTIDALARMIRDVQKGEASAEYDLRSVDDTLEHLGELLWQRNPIWEWARAYNTARASGMIRDTHTGDTPSRSPTVSPSNASTVSSPPPLGSKKSGRFSLHRREKSNTTAQQNDLTLNLSGQLTVPSTEIQTPLSPGPVIPPLAAYHFWEEVLSTLDTVPEYKLRFGLAERSPGEENLVLICDGARVGDDIYHVEHSILPVVLRDYHEYFELVGEVCLGKQDTGEWDIPIDDVFNPGSSLQNAPHIYIRFGNDGGRRRGSYASLYSV